MPSVIDLHAGFNPRSPGGAGQGGALLLLVLFFSTFEALS
jgi:hypothetical protein